MDLMQQGSYISSLDRLNNALPESMLTLANMETSHASDMPRRAKPFGPVRPPALVPPPSYIGRIAVSQANPAALDGVPLEIRRVVTGRDETGASMVAHDGVAPRSDAFRHIPGMMSRLIWATDPAPSLSSAPTDPTLSVTSIVPPRSGTRFLVVTFPPDSVFGAPGFDPAAAAAENLTISPGLAELFEADGMHTTPTIDYGIVLDGEIWLELDDGRAEVLRQHDVVVQNGTRHAWRNKSNRSATLAFILIGAAKDAAP